MDKIICQVCGSNNIIEKDNKFYCKSCDTYFVDKKASLFNNEEYFLKVKHQDDAEECLRLSPPNFYEAEDKFERLTKEYPNWSSAYWGLLRSKYGIKYEKDSDGKSIPSCYNSKYQDFRKDRLFTKAIELAETQDLKDKYISEGDKIANTFKEWTEEANKYDYDVFISFKTDEQDKYNMQNLYNYLYENGIKAFFSPVSMMNFVGSPFYDAYIFNALNKAKVLIVYGSKPEYFTTTWVQNEWTRYLKMIERKEKLDNSLIVAYQDFEPSDLPSRLNKRQCINANDMTFYPNLLKIIKGILEKYSSQATIDHMEVSMIKTTKKKVIKDKIDLVEAGATTVERKAYNPLENFEVRELNIDNFHSGESQITDRLVAASRCLKLKRYEEAKNMFQKCVDEDDKNGRAWVGLLCCQVENYALYDAILDDDKDVESFSYSLSSALDAVNNTEIINNAIDNAETKGNGLSILKFLYLLLCECVKQRFTGISVSVSKIFSIINKYNSEYRIKARDVVLKNLDMIYESNDVFIYNELLKNVASSFGDNEIDDYLEFVDGVINFYSSNSLKKYASDWNEVKIKLGEVNANSVINSVLYKFECNSFDDLVNLNRVQFIASKVIDIVSSFFDRISKDDATKVLDYLCQLEISCLDLNFSSNFDINLEQYGAPFDNAKKYFKFIIGYSFEGRDKFIKKHANYLDLLALFKNDSFFDLIVSNYPSTNADDYIKLYVAYGDKLREHNNFLEADEAYTKSFEYEDQNPKALIGLFYSKMKFNPTFITTIVFSTFSVDDVENILKHCTTKKDQTNFIVDFCEYCIALATIHYHVADKLPACIRAFNDAIKYLPEDYDTKDLLNRFAIAILQHGMFEDAIKFANLSLSLAPRLNYDARYVILLAKLQCANDEEFKASLDFSKSLPEYEELLIACGEDESLYERFGKLADECTANQNKYNRMKNPTNSNLKLVAKEKDKTLRNIFTSKFVAAILVLAVALIIIIMAVTLSV